MSAGLAEEHLRLLRDSAISDEVACERGYFTAATKAQLSELGFGQSQRRVPALVVPVWGVDGEIVTYQARPDQPRIRDGKPLKYETPAKSAMRLGALRALLAGREPLHPGLQRLLAPTPQQRLADVMLAAQLGDRALAGPARRHQLELLLRRELPVLTRLAQRHLLLVARPIL